jgi:hypothetical protein
MCKSRRRENNQVSSQEQVAIDQYSASAEERETVCCFLDFQEIRASPRKTQNPVIECRESEQAAQSLSQKALSLRYEEVG